MTNFERNLRDQLRSGEQELDDSILNELQARRMKAQKQSYFSAHRKVLIPLSSMALASFAAFFLIVSPLPQQPGDDQILSESLDGHDLDFYYWLAETQDISES